MAKKGDFPNNWLEFYEADEDMFVRHTFEELMNWKVKSWELPSSVSCIIRTTDVATKRVKEFVYQRRSAAESKVAQLLSTPNIEFIVCDHEAIHHVSPEDIQGDDPEEE